MVGPVSAQDSWQPINGPTGGSILAGTRGGESIRSTLPGAPAGSDLPIVVTGPATDVTTSSAILNGTVNPNGSATIVYFEWGSYQMLTNMDTGNRTGAQSIGSGTTAVSVSGLLSSNDYPGGQYSYRVVAENSAGTKKGYISRVFLATRSTLGSWRQPNGPYGGRIQALVKSPAGYVFAGACGGGVFRSGDNGASWTEVNNGLYDMQVQSLAIGSSDTQVRSLAIGSSGRVLAGTESGVFGSTDNGSVWMELTTGLNILHVRSIAASSSGLILAGTEGGGVVRSTDDGANWTPINGGLTGTTVWSLAIDSAGNVYAGTNGTGVFRSTDAGGNWTAVNGVPTGSYVQSLAVSPAGHIYAGLGNGGVWRSTDNGVSWSGANIGLTTNAVTSLAFSTSGSVFAGAYGAGVLRSTDGGANWTFVKNGLTNTDVMSLSIAPGGYILAGTDDGVFRSNDNGSNWSAANNGMMGTYSLSIAINSSGHIFVGSWGNGVFRSTDNGGTWTSVSSGLMNPGAIYSLAINSSGHIFAGTGNNGVFRSTDNAENWSSVSSGLSGRTVNSLAINLSGHIFAGCSSGNGVFRSTDNGGTWTSVSSGLISPWAIWSLAINSSGHIFAATGNNGVFRSTDNGSTWATVKTEVLSNYINSLAINSAGQVFAGSWRGTTYRTTDNGGNWTNSWISADSWVVRSLAINSSGQIFAGSSGGGVFTSTDNGVTWTDYNLGLASKRVLSLAINSLGYVYAGTADRGVIRTEQAVAVAQLPSVTTLAASSITAMSATLNGTVNPNGSSTTAYFEWHPDTGAINQSALLSLGSGNNPIQISATIGGISANRTFYFRAVAQNAGGTQKGAWLTFSTSSAVPPSVTTSMAMNIAPTTAIVTGTVNPHGMLSTTWFEWGTTSSLASYAATVVRVIGSDTVAVTVTDTLVDLIPSTLYYYRIVGQSTSGQQKGPIRSFRTAVGVPSATTLSIPTDGAVGVSTGPSLSWNQVAGASSYHLQVSTNNLFSTLVIDDTTLTGTSRQIGPLLNNTTYYWRVRGKNEGGYGTYSPPWSFTTIVALPSTVTLISPLDGSVGLTVDPTVSWSGVTSAVVYHVELSTSPSFSSLVLEDTTLVTTSRQLSGLLNGTTYYWRVHGRNAAGDAPYSPIWSFTTIIAIPSAAVLQAPASTATGLAIRPTLTWAGLAAATSYHIQVSQDVNFGSLSVDDTTLANTSSQIGPLQNNTTYYWRVRGKNAGGYGPYSLTWSFTTIVAAPTLTVILSAPVDKSAHVTLSQALTWLSLSDAATYHLQVSTTQMFASAVFDDTTITQLSRQVASLQNSTTYYWRVRGRNAGGYGPYSATWSFTTIVALPPAATLSFPSNGAMSVPVAPILTWGATTGVMSYHIQLSTSSSFTTAVVDDTTLTTTSRQITGLQNSTLYYWRVRGKNDAGYGPFSPTWSFTTVVAVPATVSLLSPSDGAGGVSISPTVSWSPLAGVTTYHLQFSANASLSPAMINDTSLTGTTKSISSLQNNTTYYWRVRGKNEGGYGSYSPTWSFATIPVYTQTVSVSTSLTFATKTKANEYSALDYRLLGLLGASEIVVKDVVTGVQNEDWEVVWDNGAASNYLKRYDGSTDFKFSVGRAFWIISKTALSITKTVPAATLNSNQEVEIPLHQGWNIITNPFDRSIPWVRIQTVNNTTASIYSFNGAFNNSTTLDPYAGYYFFNGSPSPVLATLRVPFSSAFGKVAELEQKTESGWRMIVEVSTGGETPALSEAASGRVEGGDGRSKTEDARRETIEIGVEREANDGLDGYDQRMPRSLEKASIYLDRPQWDGAYNEFGKDIKSESNQLKKWEFTVEGKLLEKKVVRVTGIESIPSTEDVYLVDKDRGLVVDLRQGQEYTTEMVKGKMTFEILVGRRETVDEETKKLMPTEIKVGPNYPNPFNPETMIPVTLPEALDVRIVIYDILGRQVKLLYDGPLAEGRHWLTWDGQNDRLDQVSSGIYLYRAILGNRIKIQGKMVIIR